MEIQPMVGGEVDGRGGRWTTAGFDVDTGNEDGGVDGVVDEVAAVDDRVEAGMCQQGSGIRDGGCMEGLAID